MFFAFFLHWSNFSSGKSFLICCSVCAKTAGVCFPPRRMLPKTCFSRKGKVKPLCRMLRQLRSKAVLPTRQGFDVRRPLHVIGVLPFFESWLSQVSGGSSFTCSSALSPSYSPGKLVYSKSSSQFGYLFLEMRIMSSFGELAWQVRTRIGKSSDLNSLDFASASSCRVLSDFRCCCFEAEFRPPCPPKENTGRAG